MSNAKASMSLSLHPDFVLDLASTSLIGSRAKLQDIPKVEQLIIGRIRNYVIESFVWPKVKTFNLPKVGGKRLSPVGETSPPEVNIDSPLSSPKPGSYKYADVDGKHVHNLDAEDMLRSPSMTSTADDEEEEEELGEDHHVDQAEDEDSDLAYNGQPHSRLNAFSTPEGNAGRISSGRSGTPASLRPAARASAIESGPLSGNANRRLRRGSSLSSSTTASDVLAMSTRPSKSSGTRPAMLSLSPPSLSASTTSRSDAGSAFSATDIRQRVPLHSPGLGIGLKPGPSKRHSIQAYLPSSGSPHMGLSSAYSNHLSRTSSVTSLPTLLSPRAEQPSAAKLAALLDSHNAKREAERLATQARDNTESSRPKSSRSSPSRPVNQPYTSPTTRSQSKQASTRQ